MKIILIFSCILVTTTISTEAEKVPIIDAERIRTWSDQNGVRRHFYGQPQTYQYAKAFCEATGGKLYEPKCRASNDRLSESIKLYSQMKKTSWLGITDNVKEGNFKYAENETPLSWSNWSGQSGPIGNNNGKNCVKIDADGKWHVQKCSLKLTFICEEREYPSLKWAEWETWSSCSKSCGDGIQTRKRTIENPELIYEHQETSYVPFGLECDAEEDKKCNLEPCPENCIWTNWETWTSCEINCIGGTRTRTRKQQPEAQHGGTECTGEATESQNCGDKALFDIKLNGGSKDYEGFVEIKTIYNDYLGICDKVTGLEEGDVLCKMLGFPLGAENTWQGPTESQDSDDNIHLDDLVCTGSENCIFECISENSATESSKKFEIWMEKTFFNSSLPTGYEVKKCNASDWLGLRCKKKLDCQWSEWTSYSNCSVECGTGTQTRTREKTVEEQYGGLCSGSAEDTIICTLNPCPINCEWKEWTAWESCSVTCGNGTQKRTRTPYIAAKYGGLECKGLWHKKNDYEYKGCSNDEVCSFTSLPLLVTHGSPNGDKFEVIDLENEKSICEGLDDDTILSSGGGEWATGGLVNNQPVLCRYEYCHVLGQSNKIKLNEQRHKSSSIVVGNKLWIIGGEHSGAERTTELVDIEEKNSIMLGDMPVTMDMWWHCATQINSTHGIITGGYREASIRQTLILNFNDFDMTTGPTLQKDTHKHSCTRISATNGTDYVIVVGGEYYPQDSEIMVGNSWKDGPQLPQYCYYGKMVLMPNGKEAILVGCMYYTEKLFKLYWNEGNLVWTTMSQTMKYPRSYSPIAMFIPDEINTCKLVNALNIKKDQLIYTFQSWGPKYKVELDITFWKQYGDWQNVFHFTTDGNCCNLGQRIPFLGVLSNTFRIGSAVNDNVNYEIDFNFELGKYYNIIIEQYEDQENIWKYQIKINGELSYSFTNENPQKFKDVKFYAGDNWHSKAFTSEYGKVWNMRVNDIPFISVDCLMGEWSDWTECSESEACTRSKTREILGESVYGGLECGVTRLEEYEFNNIEIKRNNLLHTFDCWGMEFMISFDINLKQLPSGRNLLHFTTGEDSGYYGNRMPAISTSSKRLKIYQSASNTWSRNLYDLYGTVDSLQNVVYKHTKRSDGKFWIEIWLDGELKYQYENQTPTCMENMKFYASNPWSYQTPVTINKFKIITDDVCCPK